MILAKFHQLRTFLWTTHCLGVAFLSPFCTCGCLGKFHSRSPNWKMHKVLWKTFHRTKHQGSISNFSWDMAIFACTGRGQHDIPHYNWDRKAEMPHTIYVCQHQKAKKTKSCQPAPIATRQFSEVLIPGLVHSQGYFWEHSDRSINSNNHNLYKYDKVRNTSSLKV